VAYDVFFRACSTRSLSTILTGRGRGWAVDAAGAGSHAGL